MTERKSLGMELKDTKSVNEMKDLVNFREAIFYTLSQIDIRLETIWKILDRIESLQVEAGEQD